MNTALRVGEEAYSTCFLPSVTVGNEVVRSVDLGAIQLETLDAVVLLTPHTSIDYDHIIRRAPLVIDTHSGLQPREAPNVVNIWVPSAPSPVLS